MVVVVMVVVAKVGGGRGRSGRVRGGSEMVNGRTRVVVV